LVSLSSISAKASGHRTGTTERHATEPGTNTERTGSSYESSPLAYDQPEGTTTTAQHHGHGFGTGLGHHKSHQEGKLHIVFIFEILHLCYTGTYAGQDTGNCFFLRYIFCSLRFIFTFVGVGSGDIKPTKTTTAEQAYPGTTDTGIFHPFSNLSLFTSNTTGSGIGTDNQYSTTGHPSHHLHHGKFLLLTYFS
jgi:hypothetical protein